MLNGILATDSVRRLAVTRTSPTVTGEVAFAGGVSASALAEPPRINAPQPVRQLAANRRPVRRFDAVLEFK
jgi:hypothetical protein